MRTLETTIFCITLLAFAHAGYVTNIAVQEQLQH